MDKGEGWCQEDDRHNTMVKNGATTFACHCHGIGQAADTGGGSVGHHFTVLHAELRDVILRHRQQLRVPIQLRLPTHSQQLSTIS